MTNFDSFVDRIADNLTRTGQGRLRALCCAASLSIGAACLTSTSAPAAELSLQRGDAAVTGFSGTMVAGEAKSGSPLDVTFIDPENPALRVFDLSKLGGKPEGQIADAPVRLMIPARDIGQVFGVTTDSDAGNTSPNIYAAATSLYGLQIVRDTDDGPGTRLVKGEPGARWMDGQFGRGGGPGSIWKIDGTTGKPSLFATISQNGAENSGAGLGAIAFDPASKQFFVTDLETGLIHRLDRNGAGLGTFDHGVDGRPAAGQSPLAHDASRRANIESTVFSIEDPATWGFADRRRMVFAVTVQGGRLYYSVAEGPQVWSVGIDNDGSVLQRRPPRTRSRKRLRPQPHHVDPVRRTEPHAARPARRDQRQLRLHCVL